MAKLIVGLGNPGEEYKNTRHNIGFKIIDSIAKKQKIELDKEQFNGKYGAFMLNDEKIIIAKPLTYMNLSGDFVSRFKNYYNVDINDIIIIHDDVDINLGNIKLKTSGSSGGQNGVKDIINKLGTENFKRIRVGVGPKNPKIDLAKFVLDNFSKNDNDKVSQSINLVGKIIENLNNASFSNLLDYVLRKK